MVLALIACGQFAWAAVPRSQPDPRHAIAARAPSAQRWVEGPYEVWVLAGGCRIEQGTRIVDGRQAVLWIDRSQQGRTAGNDAIVYLEGDVRFDDRRNHQARPAIRAVSATMTKELTHWYGRFHTTGDVRVTVPRVTGQPRVKPPVYQRAVARRDRQAGGVIRRTQFTPGEDAQVLPDPVPRGTRRVRILPRSDRMRAEWSLSPDGRERIGVIDGGVTLLIDGLEMQGVGDVGTIDVSTDRLVIWTPDIQPSELNRGAFQRDDLPLEIYMEGNIEFRQGGDRVIYADRMFYNVANRTGTVLDAELVAPVAGRQGRVRLRARSIHQLDADRFLARGAEFTTSELAVPRYSISSEELTFTDTQTLLVNPLTGEAQSDAAGQPVFEHQQSASGVNNTVRVSGFPVFFWPTMATNLEQPSLYMNNLRVKSNSVFGFQLYTDVDAYQLFGIRNPPHGTAWDLSFDYLSERGPAGGTTFGYNVGGFFGVPNPAQGFFDAWFVDDGGLDDLGRDRLNLFPEKSLRGRVFWRHRQRLAEDWQLTGQIGYISDRNFLEEYFENEWDDLKDQSTDVELKRLVDNRSLSMLASAHVNDFFTDTEWLPRADHFRLGQPLLWNRLTWYEHSSVGYGRLRPADRASMVNPVDFLKSQPLAWEVPVQGERVSTRQEIDLPVQLGPVKVVPYLLGEATHWGQDITGNDNQRLYGQAGVRASLPLWKVDPAVENELFNLHGLAHKVVFDAELFHADSNRDLSAFPLYDPLDDNSIERFRQRYAFDTFGGAPPLPLPFDERYYALRTGLARWVTSPATEIADDLAALRLGVHQRWQTKRGPPGERRIIDWIVLDLGATYFPQGDRDNFGDSWGLVNYDFRWHVGDRLTLLADGIFDFFDDGQQIATFGGLLDRPGGGSIYLGFRLLQGPIDAQIVAASFSYRMSEHWIATFGSTVDLASDMNIGQHLAMTRLGESFNIRLGINVDTGRDDVGVNLSIEPRFFSGGRLSRTDVTSLPMSGVGRL